LIRRLQQYERFKKAAMDLDAVPREDRDFFTVKVEPPEIPQEKVYADLSVDELLNAFSDVLKRADMFESHQVEMEKLSTREKMTDVLSQLQGKKFMPFVALFKEGEGRLGVVVTFLAIMELVKESMIDIVQTESFGPIHVKAKSA
jgi:segregation and condensation protein A